MDIRALRHQNAAVNLIVNHKDIPYVFLIGGFGCLTGDALIDTPAGPVPLYQFEGGLINTPLGIKNATQPIPAQTEVVEILGDDFQIHCNGAHQVQQVDGTWIRAVDLLHRSLLREFFQCPLETMQGIDLSVPLADVLHWTQRVLGYLFGYLSCFHFDDEQLQCLLEDDPDLTPLQEYVLQHTPLGLYRDGDERTVLECIRLCLPVYHLSRLHSKHRKDLRVAVSEVLRDESYQKLRADSCLRCGLSPCLRDPAQYTPEERGSISHLSAYDTSCFDTYIISQNHLNGAKVKEVSFKGLDRTYRFHVEEAECYYANGILHHNCGKSFTDVILCLYLYSVFQGCGEHINIGLLGVTIKLLSQTVLADLERAFDSANIPYRDNKQAGTLTVGNITFIYLAMQNPDDIYAHNFHCAIVDEIDEVPAERVRKIVTAIQERCRKTIPVLNRDPFIFFSTTAQGLGGTYQLVRYFDKNHIPYAVIHAHTADNPHLASSQIELLRKLYTEDEARAYLDGEFINLATGRVYYEFNRNKHVAMRFPLNPGETIYVGQDFNYMHNASVECVTRGDRIYAVNAHHWNSMDEAPRRLRELYPNNPIVFIPDASGKEIMQGVAKEFNDAHIQIYWNNKNPSIAERIMAVNKLFRTGRLYVFDAIDDERDSLVDKLIMALETRDFDDATGKPRKENGPDATDHQGDALEYAVWRIIYGLQGFEDIIDILGKTFHSTERWDD